MKKLLVSLAVVLGLTLAASVVHAEVLWTTNFSKADVKNWGPVNDPDGGSTIKSVPELEATQAGGVPVFTGEIYIASPNSQPAFGPYPMEGNFIPFDPAKKSDYTFKWKVLRCSKSVSWEITIDEFDDKQTYLDTVWAVGLETNEVEKDESKNLGSFPWSPNTRYIIPKIQVHTGYPKQAINLSYMTLERAAPKKK